MAKRKPEPARLILAGDIGGTNARLALYSWKDGAPALVESAVYPSRKVADFCQVVELFAGERRGTLAAACLGIAGPVRNNRVTASNLSWVVDAAPIAAVLGLPSVELINDLEASAHGLTTLGPRDVAVLNEGEEDPRGNAALVSAGTGLGEASVPWRGDERFPVASEGGHVDFAPRDELEMDLLRFLIRDYGRVSYERVLSGPGLFNIYRFLRDTGRGAEDPALAREMAEGDAPAVIASAALERRSATCVQALELFVSLYGAEAGNVALKFMAAGGVYLGGGIAPKILKALKGPGFMKSFLNKGRLRPFLEKVPVRVVLNPLVALAGAARRAFLAYQGLPARLSPARP